MSGVVVFWQRPGGVVSLPGLISTKIMNKKFIKYGSSSSSSCFLLRPTATRYLVLTT
jgi:hypothetical protein